MNKPIAIPYQDRTAFVENAKGEIRAKITKPHAAIACAAIDFAEAKAKQRETSEGVERMKHFGIDDCFGQVQKAWSEVRNAYRKYAAIVQSVFAGTYGKDI